MFKILLAVIIVTTTILFFDLEIARSQVSSEAMDQSEIVLEKATINNDILLYISENKFIIENIDHGIRREIVSIPVIDFILSPTNLQFIFVTTYQQVGVGEISFSDEGLIVTTKLLQDSKNHPIVNRSWNNGFFRVIWAKDGSRFAYLATNSKYYSYNLSGDELALPDSMTQFFGWSIDNHWIAYCEADQSFWVKGQNENPFLVYQQATCQSDILITSPVLWSPTENIIAYTYNFFYEFMSDGPPNPGQTGIFDVQTKKVLSQNTGAPGSWSPDGEMINLVQIISIGATGHYFANLVVVEKNNKPLIQIENVDITRGLFSRGYSWGWYGKDYLFGNIHISDDKNQIEEFPWEVIQASEQGNSILAYQINGPNLSNVYCVQREMGGIEPLSFVDSSRLSGVAMPGLWGAISPDGNWVAISILTDTGSIRRLGRCDGTKEIDLVPYDNYLFSPNSRWLAGEGDLDQDGVQVWLYNLNDATNYPMPINIDQNDGYAYYAWLKFPTPITGNGTSVTKTDETPSIHPPSPEILETQPANTSSTSEEDLGNLKKLYQLNFISIFTALIIYFCVNLIFLVYIFPNYSKRLYLRTSKITCKFWLAWIFVALLSSFISYWASQLISGYGNLLVFINKVISWSIAILLNSFGQSWLWKRSKDYSRKWLFISILSVFAGLLITVVLGSSIKIGNLLNSAGLVGGGGCLVPYKFWGIWNDHASAAKNFFNNKYHNSIYCWPLGWSFGWY